MKARYINIIFSVVLIALTSTSCANFLDRAPQDAITDLNYWQTTDELKLICNNFYPTLYIPDQNADNQSDNCVTASPNSWLFNQAVVPATGGGWSASDWSYIRNANYFLTHYQSVQGDPNEINEWVGEIYFFRAYQYFNKVKAFGDVPWINKNLNVNDTIFLYKPRTDRKIVIDSVIADLTYAVNYLPAPSKVETGRLHKYAALQMLARVALYQGTWMKYRNVGGWETYLNAAVNAAQTIMNEGGYQIVKPTAQYYYKAGNLVNAQTNTYATKDYPLSYREQFIQEDLTKNGECVLPKIYQLNVLTSGLSRSVNESGVGVSKDLIEDFLCDDGKPIALSPEYLGDDSAVMEMTNRDPRLRNMIDNRFLPNYLNGTTPTSYFLTPASSSTTPTGYMSSKFRSPIPAQNEANQTTYDRYVFRYAEVLLIYAEAKAELGTITQSDIDKSINLLRARLDESMNGLTMGRLTLNPPADPNATTITGAPRYGYAVSPLIYEIRRERRIELAFEGFRWDDIVRWKAGKLIENPKTEYGIVINDAVKKEYNFIFSSNNYFTGQNIITINDWDNKTKNILSPYTNPARKWDDKLYLNPIPLTQITLSNGTLTQNPGW